MNGPGDLRGSGNLAFKSCLVGGDLTILNNDGVRQWVLDDIPYMKWKIENV